MYPSEQLTELAARKAELRAEAEQIRRGFRDNFLTMDSTARNVEAGVNLLRILTSREHGAAAETDGTV